MAKENYSIPIGLDQNLLETKINLSGKNSQVSFGGTVTLSLLLAWMASVMGCFLIMGNTFLNYATLIEKGLFIIVWLFLTALCLTKDKTNRYRYTWILSVYQRLVGKNKEVQTSKNKNQKDLYKLVGIKHIDEQSVIHYVDGTYGYMYEVVGSATTLLFDQDRDFLIRGVENFYKKISSEFEVITITMKEPQRTHRQVASLDTRYRNLDSLDNDDMVELLNEQYDALKNYVGTRYKSFHQYKLIKSQSLEMLYRANELLRSEATSNSNVFRLVKKMPHDDVLSTLGSIYKKGDNK